MSTGNLIEPSEAALAEASFWIAAAKPRQQAPQPVPVLSRMETVSAMIRRAQDAWANPDHTAMAILSFLEGGE